MKRVKSRNTRRCIFFIIPRKATCRWSCFISLCILRKIVHVVHRGIRHHQSTVSDSWRDWRRCFTENQMSSLWIICMPVNQMSVFNQLICRWNANITIHNQKTSVLRNETNHVSFLGFKRLLYRVHSSKVNHQLHCHLTTYHYSMKPIL